jgi:small-conductance mechanosensitive channel
MKRILLCVWLALVPVVALWYYVFGGQDVLRKHLHDDARKVVFLAFLAVALLLAYAIFSVVFRKVMHKAGAKEGEAKMLLGVVRAILLFIGFLVALNEWFSMGALGTIFAAFGGMFLGWALQAPVSGLAGWLLTSVIRPFSVGDRVLLPSYGLVGDVLDVTPLYTILNQVGGSVGSEEPANRTILVPNAMLFNTLVINYTPKHQSRLIEESQKKTAEKQGPSYMLDEFVLRITFDSDWDAAERILLEAAREVTAEIIRQTGQEPYIRGDITDWYGAFMRLRFMTIATERPKIMYQLTRRIYKAVQASDKVDIAIPYVYSFKKHALAGFQPSCEPRGPGYPEAEVPPGR